MLAINNKTAFGLDISDKNLRLIQLRKTGKKISVQAYNEVKLPIDCIKNGEVKQPAVFLDALDKLIKTKHGNGALSNEVFCVLPEEKSFLKVIELPTCPEDQIVNKIKEFLPQNLPLDINDIYFDWQIIASNEQKQSVLVGASPKNIVDNYFDLLIKAKLVPVSMEIEAAAICQLLIDYHLDHAPQIIIDLGANRSGLFLYDHGVIKFTISLAFSGNEVSNVIMNALKINLEQAEEAKIVCGLDEKKCHGVIYNILDEKINELSEQINKALDFYRANFKDANPIEKIVLCGGGANFTYIDKVLKEHMNIPVYLSNPWQKIKNPNHKYFNEQNSQSYITAIGLALRGLNSPPIL